MGKYLGGLPYDRDEIGPVNVPGKGVLARRPIPGAPPQAQRWLNKSSASNYPFRIGTTSEQIVPANPLRTYLLIQNKDAGADMFVNFGQKATLFNGIIIIPRGNFELIGGARGGAFCPFNSVWILGDVADMEGVLIEGVLPLD